MDPDHSAQDVARCDLCQIAIAESYCDFCHVNLCKPCIGEHMSDEYDKHKIVPFQQRRSTLIYPKCQTHQNEACKYQCKDCNIFVCFHCLALKQHNNEHELSNLEELFNSSKERLQKDTEELEHISPTYKEIATELENQIASLDGEYEKLTTETSKQREQLHKEVDKFIDKLEEEIGEIKVKHQGILQKHLDEIKEIQTLIQQNLIASNRFVESNEVRQAIQYSSKCKELSKLPPTVKVKMPRFCPKFVEREELFSFFGELIPLSVELEERSSQKTTSFPRELLDEPAVLNTFKTGLKKLRNVTCLNEEEIWTAGETNEIKCFNIHGTLQRTVKAKANDITVDSDGALVYSTGRKGTVNKVKNGQKEEFLKFQGWKPFNLHVTIAGDLLITMCNNDDTQSKVVRYSGSVEKQTIQFDDEGRPLFSTLYTVKYISENRNLDICVADRGAGAVVVVSQAGKLRFRYTGNLSSNNNEPVSLTGIATDSQSHILTADGNNNCIHIIDADGQFLRLIDKCNLEGPFGLSMGFDDSLFVCEYGKGNVKKIKYLK